MTANNFDFDYLVASIPSYVKRVADILVANGFEGYLVGGSVRDLLLHRVPKDFDIATNALPENIQALFPKTVATGAQFGTITVVMEGEGGERFNVEVTTYRSESEYFNGRWPAKVEFATDIKKDLQRRDFTINALALNLDNLKLGNAVQAELILDLFGGLQDLENKIIKAVGHPIERFKEDGLRPVRACRLASQLGFVIEDNTKNSISEVLDVVQNVSIERFREEFIKLLMKSAKPSYGIELLRETGILKMYIPELLEGIGVVQPEFHEDDVYTHLLKVVDLAQDEIKLAALFHDIGKPRTISKDSTGTHFYQHDVLGAKITREIMARLKFSNKDIEHTELLVRYHMFYYPSADWRKEQSEEISNYIFSSSEYQKLKAEGSKLIGGWTDAAVRRFINKVGGIDNVDDLIKLRIADATANPKSTFSNVEIEALQERISKVLAEDSALKVEDLAITGHDLMKAGVAQGPAIGRILNQLLEDVLEDPSINSKEELLAKAQQYF